MTISTCVCVTLEFDNAFSIFYVWHKYFKIYVCMCKHVNTHHYLLLFFSIVKQEMYEVAKKLCSFCEGLVHDEHLQHQGWAAIMANLEDCSNSYQKLLFKFESIYSDYLQSIEDIKLKLTQYVYH